MNENIHNEGLDTRFKENNRGRPIGAVQRITRLEQVLGRSSVKEFINFIQNVGVNGVTQCLSNICLAALNSNDIDLQVQYVKLITNLMPYSHPKLSSVSVRNETDKTINDVLAVLDIDTRNKVIAAMSQQVDKSLQPIEYEDVTDNEDIVSLGVDTDIVVYSDVIDTD